MNIGNLYLVKRWDWMLFPTKETAAGAVEDPLSLTMFRPDIDAATKWSGFYSRSLNCEVTYFSPGSYVVFLEEERQYKRVLTEDGKVGWIFIMDRYNDCFKEVRVEQ